MKLTIDETKEAVLKLEQEQAEVQTKINVSKEHVSQPQIYIWNKQYRKLGKEKREHLIRLEFFGITYTKKRGFFNTRELK